MGMEMTVKRRKGRRRLRWSNNISSHLEGKNISVKDVIRTELYKNRRKWRELDSYHLSCLEHREQVSTNISFLATHSGTHATQT